MRVARYAHVKSGHPRLPTCAEPIVTGRKGHLSHRWDAFRSSGRISARRHTWTGDTRWQFPGRPSAEGSGALESRFESSHRALCDSSDLVTSGDTSTIRKSVTGLGPVTGIHQLESRSLCRSTSVPRNDKKERGLRELEGQCSHCQRRSSSGSVDVFFVRESWRIVSTDLIVIFQL